MKYVIRINSEKDIDRIAKSYNTTIGRIKKDNPLCSLKVGERIIVEYSDAIKYRVKPYDTIEGIARLHNSTVSDIAKFNNQGEHIFVGKVLFIPTK